MQKYSSPFIQIISLMVNDVITTSPSDYDNTKPYPDGGVWSE